MISCRVLGPVEVMVDGGPAPPELLWRKHLALLLYLARSPRRVRTREHLTGLLWPDKDESAARHSLNEALRVIRRAAGDDAIDTAAGQVRLAAGSVDLDADDLERRTTEGRWAEAAAMVTGEFLEGFALPGSDAFEDWLAAERRDWTAHSVRALLGWTDALLREGRAEAALAAARRAEAVDPQSDAVARAVMGVLAVLGDPAGAIDHFTRFAEERRKDGGAGPNAETRALADRLRTARGTRSAEVRTAAPDRRRAPLVGRTRELQGLLDAWDRCRGGGGASALLITGDAGTGKSRLLDEVLARVRVGGGSTAMVRAVESDREEPGAGLLGLARGGLLDAPGVPAAPSGALGVIAAMIPEWGDRFPRAVAAPGQTAAAAFGAVLGAVLGEGPLMLAVDDAQWLDHATQLALLGAIRDHATAPLAIAFAASPEPQRDELDELHRRLGTDISGAAVRLGRLDGESLRALAAWALPHLDAVSIERIARRVGNDAAGIPFLAVELLSAVAHGLDLAQGTVAWPEPFRTLTQTLPGELPDTVVAALRIGFRRLSKDAQVVLTVAAVIGDRSTEELLLRASGLERSRLQEALDELEWQRWLESDSRGYGFVARLAGQVVARDMATPGQRARLRERAGLPPSP